MIPKKIHFCWLSNDPYPSKIKECLDTWKEKLPDYEIIKWDQNRFPLDKSIWVKEAFEKKKYAFAADYIRFYALYTEGGIYLDSDVEVLKPFDDLLSLPYFIGQENENNMIEAAVIGAEKKTLWLKYILDYYQDKHFVLKDNILNTTTLPVIINKLLNEHTHIKNIANISEFKEDEAAIQILPFDFFSPKGALYAPHKTTSNSYTIHHFEGSWVNKYDNLPWYAKIWVFLHLPNTNIRKKISQKLFRP